MNIILSDTQVIVAKQSVDGQLFDLLHFETSECLDEFLGVLDEVRNKGAKAKDARKLLRSLVSAYCQPSRIMYDGRWLDSIPMAMCQTLLDWQDVEDYRSTGDDHD